LLFELLLADGELGHVTFSTLVCLAQTLDKALLECVQIVLGRMESHDSLDLILKLLEYLLLECLDCVDCGVVYLGWWGCYDVVRD
jgi:hypothetical protein